MASALGVTHSHNMRRPPRVGPFARHGWDEAGACWRVCLTTAGRKLADDFLDQYPVPLLILKTRAPGLFRGLQRDRHIGTESDAHAEALYAIVYAVQTFDSAHDVDFSTHAGWTIYSKVNTARIQKINRSASFGTVAVGPLDADANAKWPGHAIEAADDARRNAEDVAEVLANVPPRDAKILSRKFGLGGYPDCTSAERAGRSRMANSTQSLRERKAVRAARRVMRGAA